MSNVEQYTWCKEKEAGVWEEMGTTTNQSFE